MFFHAMIEIAERRGKNEVAKEIFELDKPDLAEIINDVVVPYLKREEFQFNGYFVRPESISRLVVKRTNESVRVHSKYENDHMTPGIIMYVSPSDILSYDKYTTDITKEAMALGKEKIAERAPKPGSSSRVSSPNKSRVFIVHGHDDLAKTTVARFVERMAFEPIILHEQPSAGKTIIEKIEMFSDVGFAVVIYSPDDLGSPAGARPDLKPRARQNVVFEHGFLIARLGRENVTALMKGDIETPSDIDGIVYIPFDDRGAWTLCVAKEMKASGYPIDMNRLP